MSFKTTLLGKSKFVAAAAVLSLSAFAAHAGDIEVMEPYARASAMMSQSGAAFMMIHNTGEADHLVSATSDIAEKTELHTHKEDANGVMKMIHVEEGFDVPADGVLAMARGGHHVMFLGLKEPMEQGKIINVTLTFEKAGDVMVEVPVDLERKPDHAMGNMQHGNMQHGQMKKQAD